MKFFQFWIFCSVLFFASCLDSKETKDRSEIIKMYVSFETGEYTPFMSDSPIEGMKIKEEKRHNWEVVPFSMIEGFTYEKGTEYLLEIEKIHMANPPMDGPSCRYKLIKILSKKIK